MSSYSWSGDMIVSHLDPDLGGVQQRPQLLEGTLMALAHGGLADSQHPSDLSCGEAVEVDQLDQASLIGLQPAQHAYQLESQNRIRRHYCPDRIAYHQPHRRLV